MATHSSIPAWRIPGMAEPGGLPSVGSHRVGHNWSDLQQQQLLFLEKAMATHSSPLAWKIPWTEEPGWLQSLGSQRVIYDWVTKPPQSWSTVPCYLLRYSKAIQLYTRICIYSFFTSCFYYGFSQDIEYRSLGCTVGPCYLSVLCIDIDRC